MVVLGTAVMTMVAVGTFMREAPQPEPEGTPMPVHVHGHATPTPTPTPDPDLFVSDPGEVRQFTQQTDHGHFRLHYGFVDYSGRRQDVTCTVDRAAVARAARSFGWDKTEVTGELDAEMQKVVDREIERRELRPYVHVTMHGDGEWQWEVVGRAADDPRASAEIDSFLAWLKDDFAKISARTEAQIFKRHGLLLQKHVVSIDYNGVASAATDDLGDCYDALVRAAGDVGSDRYFMGLTLALMQELTYEVPPDGGRPRDIFGLWVPDLVMTTGKGDCDSKAATFAALWRKRASRVIIILVPEHALIGVESKPGPGEKFVRVGNRYYVLCEVAGPAKLPPGYDSVAGSFEYVAIDPVAPD
jgi:hypothetical protein